MELVVVKLFLLPINRWNCDSQRMFWFGFPGIAVCLVTQLTLLYSSVSVLLAAQNWQVIKLVEKADPRKKQSLLV